MAKPKEDSITTLLGIKGYQVTDVREEGPGIVVEVKPERETRECPGCSSSQLYRRSQTKPRRVLHSWARGRRVYLLFHRRRC